MQTVLFRLDKFLLGKDTALPFRSRDKNVQAHIVYKNQSLFDFDMILVDKLQFHSIFTVITNWTGFWFYKPLLVTS